MDLAEDAPAPVEIRTRAPRSLGQLRTAHRDMAPALEEALPGASSEVDVTTGEVVVFAQGQPPAGLAQSLSGDYAVPVRFEVIDAPESNSTAGGVAAGPSCTTGFSVRRPVTRQEMADYQLYISGLTDYEIALAKAKGRFPRAPEDKHGFVTAGHCGDTVTFGPFQKDTIFRGELFDAARDERWHTLGSDAFPVPPSRYNGYFYAEDRFRGS